MVVSPLGRFIVISFSWEVITCTGEGEEERGEEEERRGERKRE